MNKDEIIKTLRKESKVSRASLPRDIDFCIKNRTLYVFVQHPAQNMQNDGAAFEGWIIILKSWLADRIEHVVLDFSPKKDLMYRYGYPEACHYNRFLYRLYNMLRIFPRWFSAKEERIDDVQNFIEWVKSNNLLLNHSLREREDVIETTIMERQIESWFVFHEGKKLLSKRWNIDEDKVFNQLPVGVFIDEISAKNAVFTRGMSAIDMWGIGKDGRGLHLIELKCGNNKGLGVIGETLFYTSIIYDTCVAEKSLFNFGKYGSDPDTSDAVAIKNNGKKFDHLTSYILAEKYHSLFSDDVAKLIAEGLNNLNIKFVKATYNYQKKDFVYEDYDS